MSLRDSPGIFQVPERGESPVCLLAPCHPGAALRAMIDIEDWLVLLCAVCGSPFLALHDWERELAGERRWRELLHRLLEDWPAPGARLEAEAAP